MGAKIKESNTNSRSAKIATLNDKFRKTETMSVTQGVFNLPDVLKVISAVREFESFTEDNDPYEEHDFGSIDWAGQTIFWKIDYYDGELRGWCDPLDERCSRVLTVMLAEEY